MNMCELTNGRPYSDDPPKIVRRGKQRSWLLLRRFHPQKQSTCDYATLVTPGCAATGTSGIVLLTLFRKPQFHSRILSGWPITTKCICAFENSLWVN